MRSDANSAVIVRSTIELAHGLGLTAVAEGVEDQYTYDALTALGCDRIQGYHVARPMPAEALRAWWSTALPSGRDGISGDGISGDGISGDGISGMGSPLVLGSAGREA